MRHRLLTFFAFAMAVIVPLLFTASILLTLHDRSTNAERFLANSRQAKVASCQAAKEASDATLAVLTPAVRTPEGYKFVHDLGAAYDKAYRKCIAAAEVR